MASPRKPSLITNVHEKQSTDYTEHLRNLWPDLPMNLYDRIPNNVNLSEDKKLQRALEKWLPNYLDWWREMGPEGFQEKDVWLRTAIDVGSEGWAHFDYVKMPEYRWGIFLEPPQPDAKVGFGDNYGRPAYQEV